MDATELAEELGVPGAQELLLTAPLARLAYDGLDGTPRVIPIGFHWDGERIIVCTSTIAPKVPAISARPAVAFSIDIGSTPADSKALLIRGTATLDTVEGVPEEFIAAATKSFDAEAVAAFAEGSRAMYPRMVRIATVPTWARFYDFGAGRLPATLQQVAEQAAGG